MNNKVSIVMPCFNAEKFLKHSIQSVLKQSHSNFELLIVNDGSKDNSLDILKEYARRDKRIILLNNRYEKGASGARRTAYDKASGRFLAFLDSDDIWKKEKLKKQISFMLKNELSFCYSHYETIDRKITYHAPKIITFEKLLFTNFIPCLTVIIDLKTLPHIDFPSIKKRNDYAIWLSIFEKNKTVRSGCCNMHLAFYRENNYGLSSNKLSNIYFAYKNIRSHGKQNIISSVFFTFFHAVIALLKKVSPKSYNYFIDHII